MDLCTFKETQPNYAVIVQRCNCYQIIATLRHPEEQ